MATKTSQFDFSIEYIFSQMFNGFRSAVARKNTIVCLIDCICFSVQSQINMKDGTFVPAYNNLTDPQTQNLTKIVCKAVSFTNIHEFRNVLKSISNISHFVFIQYSDE